MMLRATPIIQAKLAIAKSLQGAEEWSEHFQACMRQLAETNSVFENVLCRLFVSEALILNRQFATAEALCDEALSKVGPAGFAIPKPELLALKGYCRVRGGDERGLSWIDEGCQLAATKSAPLLIARVLYYKAAALHELDQDEAALVAAEEALEISERFGSRPRAISLRLLMGRLWTTPGRWALLRKAQDDARALGLLGLLRAEETPSALSNSITP